MKNGPFNLNKYNKNDWQKIFKISKRHIAKRG